MTMTARPALPPVTGPGWPHAQPDYRPMVAVVAGRVAGTRLADGGHLRDAAARAAGWPDGTYILTEGQWGAA